MGLSAMLSLRKVLQHPAYLGHGSNQERWVQLWFVRGILRVCCLTLSAVVCTLGSVPEA